MLPPTTATLMLLTGAVRILAPCAVTVVAPGVPLKTTLLVVADATVLPESKVIVTATAPAPNAKLSVDVEIDAADVVMELVAVSGPTIDTPYPPEDVMVDETTDSAVVDAAAV